MLQLRGFASAPAKVKLLEFHPVQPWICYADTSDRVRVWDWTTQQTLHDLQLGGADEEGSMEAALNTIPAKDPAFTTNPSAISYAPSRVPSGHIRQVRFLDPEVAYWQTAIQHYMVNGTTTNPPSAVNVHALDGTRLLVVVCENKLLLYDLNTRKPYEVSRAVLDNKAPSCVAFMFRGGRFSPGGQPDPGNLMTSPVLAVGCADGVVRLLHLATLRVVGRLVGNAKAGITSLLTLPSKAEWRASTQQQAAAASGGGGGGATKRSPRGDNQAAAGATGAGDAVFLPSVDLVLAGDSAGGMFVWSPFSTPLGSAEREVAPRLSWSGHSGEVWALCLTPGPEDAQDTTPKVFSAGADHRLVAWDALSLREVWRTKLDAKAPLTSLTYSQRYFNLSGAHALLATNNGPGVVAAYTLSQLPPEKGLRACVNLAGLVPPGTKKVPKAYVVAVSPVRPNLAAVGANTGMAFMTFDRMYPLPVAGLPLTNLAGAHVSPALRLPQEPVTAAYVAHMGDAVWLVNCVAVQKEVSPGVRQVVPEVVSKQHLGPAVGRTGRAIVGVSAGGEYVSVCWPASRGYVVYYRTLAGTWQEVDAGSGVDLAWHSHRDVFAVLEEPPPMLPGLGAKKPKKKLLGGKEGSSSKKDRFAAAEAAAIAASMAAATVVRIKALDGLGCSTVCQQVALHGDVPCGLHGGPLLGVALKRMTSSGAELSGEDASPVMQFYSWNGVTKVGPELPEPSVVSWDPTLRYLALAYLRQVQVLRAQPTLEVLGSLPIVGTTAAVWGIRQLYLATPTSILLAFVAAEEAQQQQQQQAAAGAASSGSTAATPSGGDGGLSLLDGPLGELAAAATATGTSSSTSSKQQSTLQFLQLAGLTGTCATSRLRSSSSGRDASLPGPVPRPPGPLALIGPRQGHLWLVNSLGQPVLLPLTHPGIRARCLCAQGDLVGSVAVGRKGLDPGQHDSLGAFLALQGGAAGAHLALMGLQGLSLDMEAELAMITGQWRRACVCCEALMRGCNDRAALSSSEAYHAHGHMRGAGAAEPGAGAAAAGPTGDGNLLASLGVTAPLATPGQLAAAAAAGQAGGGDPPVQQQQQQQKQMWGLMGFGGLFIDNYQLPPDPTDTQASGDQQACDPLSKGMVSWASPLQHDWAVSRPPRQVRPATDDAGGDGGSSGYAAMGGAATAAAGLVAAATAVAAAAQPPPQSALSLAMRLVEGSQAAGITDVTRRASQLLLAHSGLLTPPQLARLAAKVAEVGGMSSELRELVEAGVGSGSHAGQAVGFVAAALTGDLELLQRALQASSTDALAALQANTYRLPSALATEQAWNHALQHVGSTVASHSTTSYAYYSVTQSGL